jgi:DNA primase
VGNLAQKRPKSVVIFFDGDEPGEIGSAKLAAYLTRRRLQVFVARPPEGKDPDELGALGIRRLIKDAEPAVPWLTRRAGQLELWRSQ